MYKELELFIRSSTTTVSNQILTFPIGILPFVEAGELVEASDVITDAAVGFFCP